MKEVFGRQFRAVCSVKDGFDPIPLFQGELYGFGNALLLGVGKRKVGINALLGGWLFIWVFNDLRRDSGIVDLRK